MAYYQNSTGAYHDSEYYHGFVIVQNVIKSRSVVAMYIKLCNKFTSVHQKRYFTSTSEIEYFQKLNYWL